MEPDAHATYLAALRGFPVIDLWPAFLSAEAANGGDHPPLYLTADAHLSAAGRTVFATAFADDRADRGRRLNSSGARRPRMYRRS